jgi:lipopolysaccharide/colanic/teichoic acid biosynthesis glycosyltransferase
MQERVGLNGRLFNVVKFRSMRTDAEKDGQPRWATAQGRPRHPGRAHHAQAADRRTAAVVQRAPAT